MKNKIFIILLSLSSVFADDCENCYTPIANAGLDETYYIGCSENYTQVCLNGSLSTDYEGQSLDFLWELHDVSMTYIETEGQSSSSVVLPESSYPDINLVNSSEPCFFLPAISGNNNHYQHIEKYVFKLKVSDGLYLSDPDFVEVLVDHNNTSPEFLVLPETNYSLKINESFVVDLSSVFEFSATTRILIK